MCLVSGAGNVATYTVEKLIDAGALDGVQMIFAGHIDTHFPVGTFTVDSGLICSYTDPFTITIPYAGLTCRQRNANPLHNTPSTISA